MVEARLQHERRGGASVVEEAVVVVATFVCDASNTSICTKLMGDQSVVLDRPVRAERSDQATSPHDALDNAVRWRAESLCGHSVALGKREPPPKRDTYHPARRLQLGHVCHPRHPRHPRRIGMLPAAGDRSTFTCELELTPEDAQVWRAVAAPSSPR